MLHLLGAGPTAPHPAPRGPSPACTARRDRDVRRIEFAKAAAPRPAAGSPRFCTLPPGTPRASRDE
eukprot:3132258-Prymnesium_polylepis.1